MHCQDTKTKLFLDIFYGLVGKPLVIIRSILQQNIFIRKLFAEELFYRRENLQQTQHQGPVFQNQFRTLQRDV